MHTLKSGKEGDKMVCKNCGNETADGSRFCSVCGAQITGQDADGATKQQTIGTGDLEELSGQYVTPNIVKCEDGFYRWYYDYNMLKNPTILFTVFKVLGLTFGIEWLFFSIVTLAGGDGIEGFLGGLKVFGILFAVFLVIGSISYLIVAAMYGGSYMVLFEMNDKQVKHIQMPRQFKKAEALGWLNVFVGIASGRPTQVGQGLLVASKQSTTSVFESVSSVKVRRRRNTVHVNQSLEKNQVYAYPEDFDFVEQFIVSHCVNAKVK